ncbi:MAG: type II toxin-antitoxin system prevent-host-death family antitoxin [Anaerolineales bacterium]|nr:type II toxin-antitoxin system prevent-host-death family antitoxin [Anaerolineales bacterium]MCB9128243.1 type II toxin-antitoxin system prevent-host-death family antitoxin [Ardenticatenales bacterium]
MTTVGIRELRDHASELLRRVREDGESINITYRGQLTARLVPANLPQIDDETLRNKLVALDQLAVKINRSWQGEGAEKTIHEIRREL